MTERIDPATLERLTPGHASLFLKTLSKQDDFCFRTFSDSTSTKNIPMNLEGAFEATKAKLVQANAIGSGVFVVINGGGQKAKEITRIRAIFADTDGAPLDPLLALEPHMVIESSPQKWHSYWLVDKNFPLTQFKQVQQAIAEKFGTDKAVNDLSRVMRVPGFYHNKGTPFLTRIVRYTKGLPRYRIEDLVEGLGLTLEPIYNEGEVYNTVKKQQKNSALLPLLNSLSINNEGTPSEILKLKSALSYLSPDVGRGNGKFYDTNGKPLTDNWLAVIWAIKSLNWWCGRDLAVEWSRQSPERFIEADFNQDWDNYNCNHPNPIGVGSLYKRVKELGWTNPLSGSLPNPSRYNLLGRSDIVTQAPYTWRIKGLLPQYGIAAMYGPSGSGKSFLALDAAIAIAEGRTWFGKKTLQTNVLYVALEGEAGYKNRISAWEIQNAREIPRNFHFILQDLNLSSKQDVDDLIAVAPESPVIIIDTLNRASPMADENSSKDMGEILSAAKKIQSATNGLVIIIHHTGKDTSKGLRGHSSLFAALDAAIEITHSNKQRSWRMAKSKDGESGIEFHFSLNPVYLGLDSDNEPISSCTIGISTACPTTRKHPTGKQQKVAIHTIKDALASSINKRISMDVAAQLVSEKLLALPANKRKNRANSIIQSLLDSDYLQCTSENDGIFVWVE